MYDLSELHPSLDNTIVSEEGEVYNKKTGKKLKQYLKERNGASLYMVSVYAVSYTHLTLPTICSV